jgi:hydroxymethylpyrimidine pyrophosphatase-like HAD family hydrolase
MKFQALATDYDGTIAHDGRVDDDVLAALQRARRAGLKMLLVTGRELTDLVNIFPHVSTFDRIVAENGAVVYNPSTATVRLFADVPPPQLLDTLTRSHVPVSVGHSIVATVEPYEYTVLAAIRDLGLEWHLIFNKGSVMALPAGVTKATGLLAALEELQVMPERTVGIGDAENDHAFLRACGLAVAVANALPSLKDDADLVTKGPNGTGVIELVDRLLSGSLDETVPRSPSASHG